MLAAFVKANNQEEGEVAGVDDARNDCDQSLSLPLSPTFSFLSVEQVRGQSPRGGFVTVT